MPATTLRDSRTPLAVWFGVTAAALAAWGMHLPLLLATRSLFSDDSASYLDCARSLVRGLGAMTRVHSGLEPSMWIPMGLWPPGYPLLLSLGMRLGLSEAASVVAVSAGSMALALGMLTWLCLRWFRPMTALGIVTVTALMPCFLGASIACASEAPYYALSMASLLCLIVWTQRSMESRAWVWVLGAGVLAGLSWGVRYAAVALFATQGAFLLMHRLWGSWRLVSAALAVWMAGLALGTGPFALRNMTVFGKVTPYHMGPSELSLMENVRMASETVARDLTTWRTGASWLFRQTHLGEIGVLAGFVILILAMLLRRSRTDWRRMAQAHRAALLLATYVIVYTAVVILARTTYKWGAYINSRHFLQVYWILWMGVAAAGIYGLQRVRLSARMAHVLAAAGLAVAIVTQLRLVPEGVVASGRDVYERTIGREAGQALAGIMPDDQYVVAARAYLLRIHADVNARQMLSAARTDRPLDADQVHQAAGRLWGVVIDDVAGARAGKYGPFVRELALRPQTVEGFEPVPLGGPALIFRYRGEAS